MNDGLMRLKGVVFAPVPAKVRQQGTKSRQDISASVGTVAKTFMPQSAMTVIRQELKSVFSAHIVAISPIIVSNFHVNNAATLLLYNVTERILLVSVNMLVMLFGFHSTMQVRTIPTGKVDGNPTMALTGLVNVKHAESVITIPVASVRGHVSR